MGSFTKNKDGYGTVAGVHTVNTVYSVQCTVPTCYVYSRTPGSRDVGSPCTVDPMKGTVEDYKMKNEQSVSSLRPPKPETRYTARVLSTTVHTATSNEICDFQMTESDVFRLDKVMSKIDFVFFRSRLNYNICLIFGLRPLVKRIEIHPSKNWFYCLFNLSGY